jgi:hypothetical protein
MTVLRGGISMREIGAFGARSWKIDHEQATLAADRIIANRKGKSLGRLKAKNLVNGGRP